MDAALLGSAFETYSESEIVNSNPVTAIDTSELEENNNFEHEDMSKFTEELKPILTPERQQELNDNLIAIATNNVIIGGRIDGHNIIPQLINDGANVNARDKDYGDTPLILAVGFGYTKNVKALLKQGADVNIVNNSGKSPLIAAVNSKNTSIVKDLIEAGASIYYKDPHNADAFHHARTTIMGIRGIEMTNVLQDQKSKLNNLAKFLISKTSVDRNFNLTDFDLNKPNAGHDLLLRRLQRPFPDNKVKAVKELEIESKQNNLFKAQISKFNKGDIAHTIYQFLTHNDDLTRNDVPEEQAKQLAIEILNRANVQITTDSEKAKFNDPTNRKINLQYLDSATGKVKAAPADITSIVAAFSDDQSYKNLKKAFLLEDRAATKIQALIRDKQAGSNQAKTKTR